MSDEPKPGHPTLADILAATPAQLEDWAGGQLPPDPGLHKREQTLLRALTDDDGWALTREAAQTARPEVGWLAQWKAAMVPAFVTVFAMFTFVLGPKELPDVLSSKGQKQQAQEAEIVLHLVALRGPKATPKRLASGNAYHPSDRVLIGFTIKKRAGFLYLFVRDHKTQKTTMLFPSTPSAPNKPRRWAPGTRYLKVGGRPQFYALSGHRSRVSFALLKVLKKPLHPQAREKLLQARALKQALLAVGHPQRGLVSTIDLVPLSARKPQR